MKNEEIPKPIKNRTSVVKVENWKEHFYYRRLCSNLKEYKVKITNSSVTIEEGNNTIRYSDGTLRMKHLGMMASLKSMIRKSDMYHDLVENDIMPKYFDFNADFICKQNKGVTYDKVIEVDLNSAYAQTMINLGLITNEFYQKVIALPKSLRLRILGSMATKTTVQIYSGYECLDSYVDKKNDDLSRIWKIICHETAEVLRKTIAKTANEIWLGYWVDAIYLQGSTQQATEVQATMKDLGYDSKIVDLEWVCYDDIVCQESGIYLGEGFFMKKKKHDHKTYICLPNMKKNRVYSYKESI